jgi:hypothetical protein
VLTLTNVQAAIWEQTGHTMKAYRRNTGDWHTFTRALKQAAELRDYGADEAEAWRHRIAKYAYEIGADANPYIADGKRHIVDVFDARPFSCPEGRLWINLDEFARHVKLAFMLNVARDDVAVALDGLGWQAHPISARSEKTGKPRTRRYWRSPPGWED